MGKKPTPLKAKSKKSKSKPKPTKAMNPTLNPLFFAAFLDPNLPPAHRLAMLREVLSHEGPEAEELVKKILGVLAEKTADATLKKRLAEIDALLKQMKEGPLRLAVFLQLLPATGGPTQALVLIEDGATACTVVPDPALAQSLRRGERVLLEARGHALLFRAPTPRWTGEEAQFERRLDDQRLEVTLRGHERAVVFASQELMAKYDAQAFKPGAALVVNPRLSFAFDALPPQEGLTNYRFLDKGAVPRVTVRDHVGAPPKVIDEVAEHVRLAFYHRDVLDLFGQRLCFTRLLCGASGTGKTLAVQAIHRQVYELMSEFTGVPIDQLPPRLFRLENNKVLSKWLGESDQNLDRFFDEVQQLAAEPFTTPDGRQVELPVMVIIEEADGVARSRGQDPLLDRIFSVTLRRLDPNRPGLSDKLVIVLATTNEPQIVDAAFLRRVGGAVEPFGRLDKPAFRAVLQKHVQRLPLASNNGYSQDELRRDLVSQLTAWLYSPNGTDPGLVELTFAGSTTPVIKHRRDFLTGALVERAVQRAAREACRAHVAGTGKGVTLEQLMRGFHEQLLGLLAQMREQNAAQFVDLPDAVRVASLRRIPQPSHLPIELQTH